MIFTDEKGKRWKVGSSRSWEKGLWYLTEFGLVEAVSDGVDGARAFLEVLPVPTEHTFGGVVFEETGEKRKACEEWALMSFPDGSVDAVYHHRRTLSSFTILRPVRVEGQP